MCHDNKNNESDNDFIDIFDTFDDNIEDKNIKKRKRYNKSKATEYKKIEQLDTNTNEIIIIHKKIIHDIEVSINRKIEIQTEINKYEWIRDNIYDNKNMANQYIIDLYYEMNNLLDADILYSFKENVASLIIKLYNISQSHNDIFDDDEEDNSEYILEYISILEKYIPSHIYNKYINTIKIPKNICENEEDICTVCKLQTLIISEDDKIVCTSCGADVEILDNYINYKDNARINLSSKYVYSRIIHFENTINCYQTTQQKIFYTNVIAGINDWVSSNNINVKFLSKQDILNYLKSKSLVKHYDDFVAIWCYITTKTVSNIEIYKPYLIKIFNHANIIFFKYINKQKKYNRTNFINDQFMLMTLLRYLGNNVELDRLSLPDQDNIDQYNNMWNDILEYGHKDWIRYKDEIKLKVYKIRKGNRRK